MTCIMDIFNYEQVLSLEALLLKRSLEDQFPFRFGSLIATASHEFNCMRVSHLLDEVSKEHESPLENANHD